MHVRNPKHRHFIIPLALERSLRDWKSGFTRPADPLRRDRL